MCRLLTAMTRWICSGEFTYPLAIVDYTESGVCISKWVDQPKSFFNVEAGSVQELCDKLKEMTPYQTPVTVTWVKYGRKNRRGV